MEMLAVCALHQCGLCWNVCSMYCLRKQNGCLLHTVQCHEAVGALGEVLLASPAAVHAVTCCRNNTMTVYTAQTIHSIESVKGCVFAVSVQEIHRLLLSCCSYSAEVAQVFVPSSAV